MKIKRIAVVGTGLMGKGIAHVFAVHGYKVDLFGRRDDIAGEFISYADYEASKGRISIEQKDIMLGNTCFYNLNYEAHRLLDSNLVIETVKEDMEAKVEVIRKIGANIRKSAIVASNTSSLSITKLAESIPYPENFLGMHFFSPVPMMKLVEVASGEKTNGAAADDVCRLLEGIGKMPVKVKDSPGFVLNRGLALLINEASYMYCEKTAGSVEDIDSIFINGLGLKVGPLKLADLVGIDVSFAMITNVYEGFRSDKYKPCPLLHQMLDEGKAGKKTGMGFYCY